MNSIADSEAFWDPERMLVQHQAALTLLQQRLASPHVATFRWLDLASGRGQIITNLKDNLSESARRKIQFVGYDIDNAHTRAAAKVADSLGLGKHDFAIGELAKFNLDPTTQGTWDFITLTNTIHEISPKALAVVLSHALPSLADDGCLFIYDMEQLPSPELGAVPWTKEEFATIVASLSRSFGADAYVPEIGRWKHKTCYGWNVQLRPTDMRLPTDWRCRVEPAIEATARTIVEVLRQKFSRIALSLEGLTKFGAETDEETVEKVPLLFDYWAISRALELKP